jgi:hypothetical protein
VLSLDCIDCLFLPWILGVQRLSENSANKNRPRLHRQGSANGAFPMDPLHAVFTSGQLGFITSKGLSRCIIYCPVSYMAWLAYEVRRDVRAITGGEASKFALAHDEETIKHGVSAHLVDVVIERSSQGAVGIVFSLQQGSDKCVVTSLKPGSPASGAVAPGDEIYYVDGKPVAGLSTAELMGIMKGDAFSRVTFTIAPGHTSEMLHL